MSIDISKEGCPRNSYAYENSPFTFLKDHKTHWRKDNTCSFCGSLNPDALFKAIEDGATIVPTDKTYKIYIRGDAAPHVSGACKFYFQHFDMDDCKRFVELYNNKKITLGEPGYFYNLPYFMTYADAE